MGCCMQSQDPPPSTPGNPAFKGKPNGPDKGLGVEVTDQLASTKINLEQFRIEKVLGKGSFGKVMLVTKIDTGHVYAMKVLKKEQVQKRNQRIHTQNEREILEGTRDHPFIVQLRYAFQTADKLYMVMDFMPGGELFFHLRRSGRFTEDRARYYIAEILLALEYVHTNKIVYRDLKPENVLLDEDGHVCITDFGLSKTGLAGSQKAFTFCGTPEYLAPEIIKGVGHDFAVDYWSLGALLYEMLSGAPPFYSKDREQMFRNILNTPVVMKPYFTDSAADLLKGLLQIEPLKRLTTPEVIKSHPFFKSIDWELLIKRGIKPPFKPRIKSSKDAGNFDKMFTDEKPVDSYVDSALSVRAKAANKYDGFTYNPTRI